MKKFFTIFLLLFLILFFYQSFAYSTSNYSIDIPSDYNKISNKYFVDEKGQAIQIQIEPNEFSSSKDPYTEEGLNKFVRELEIQLENNRDELKKQLYKEKDMYGFNMTEEQISEYVDSFKLESIERKEITTCTKNDYKCFHILVKCSMGDTYYYVDEYIIMSADEVYTLSISCFDINDLYSKKIKNVVKSFTIKNYKPFVIKINSLTSKIISAGIITIVSGIIGTIASKIKKQKTDIKNVENKIEDGPEKINNNNEMDNTIILHAEQSSKYDENITICPNCKTKIDKDWNFCKYCGNKTK
ncbi:MAG: zinc ribbon domain-containing protein [Clostridia bacterium]|nr:zinc ribbon domain-containing protein [Clostridia bacterium]